MFTPFNITVYVIKLPRLCVYLHFPVFIYIYIIYCLNVCSKHLTTGLRCLCQSKFIARPYILSDLTSKKIRFHIYLQPLPADHLPNV